MNEKKQGLRPNELRIGNVVNVPNKLQSPFRIDGFEYLNSNDCKVEMNVKENAHPLTWWLKDLEGVDITEDVLLKVGFEWSIRHQGFHNGIFKITEQYKNGYRFHFNEGWIHFKYIHHFQNLIFDLTGEELDVTKLMEGS